MKIVMSKEEFNDFAVQALKNKYASIVPDGKDVMIDVRHSEVSITFVNPGTEEE